MSVELQPTEFEALRYGDWRIIVRHVEPKIRPGLSLFFWRFTHVDAGDLASGFDKDYGAAIGDARAAAVKFWPSLAQADWDSGDTGEKP